MLEGRRLALTGGDLKISQDVLIDGDSNNDGIAVTLDARLNSRLLEITGGSTDVALKDLTLANGRSAEGENGGAIRVTDGFLVMEDSVVSGNSGDTLYGSLAGGFPPYRAQRSSPAASSMTIWHPKVAAKAVNSHFTLINSTICAT